MMRRHRTVNRPHADINVTSLLDVVFVLLISFMIVAPALKHGVELDLPQVREAQRMNPADRPIAVTVAPDKHDPKSMLTYVNGDQVPRSELVATIQAKKGEKATAVTLEADKAVDWETMADVLATLQSGGIANIGILTEKKR